MARATRLVAATRRLLSAPDGEMSDRALITRFAQSRDERAFAELVARHGALVYGACRRLVSDAATADDVFQATFLILAREAGRVHWRTAIGPWLYTIAVRLARKTRSRRTGAPLDAAMDLAAPAADPSAPLVWAEVKGALDEELARLPAALSQPLVLCYLQGLTRDEAAGRLGISLARLKRDLARGRNRLRARLSQRGIALAVAGWGVALMSPPLAAELRERVILSACTSTQTGTISSTVAELVAGCTRTRSGAWVIAPVVLLVGLGAALAFALRPVDSPPTPVTAKPGDEKLEPDARAPKGGPMDPLPEGAVTRFGTPRLLDFTIAKSAGFSPDGKLLATGGPNGHLCVWDAATGKLDRKHKNGGSVFDLRWRGDGTLAAVTLFTFGVFLMQTFGGAADLKDNDERLSDEYRAASANPPQDMLTGAFLSGDGKWVFAELGSKDWKTRRIERFPFTANKTSATVKSDRTLPYPDGFGGFWTSRDGRTLVVLEAAAGERPARLVAYDLSAKDYDHPVWERVMPASKEHGPAVEACLPIDGKRTIVLTADGTVDVWDGPGGKRIRELPKMPRYYHDGNHETRGIDLAPDGKRVAMIFRGPSREVGGRVVEVETGREVCALVPQPLPRFGGVARFSPDGTRVAQVTSGVARIWNAKTGADAVARPGHNGHVTGLLPTADGNVVSTGTDNTIRKWDPRTGKEMWRTTFARDVAPRFVTPEGIVAEEGASSPVLFTSGGPGPLLDGKTGDRSPLPGALGRAVTVRRNNPSAPPTPDRLLAMTPDGKSMVTLAWHAPAFRLWSWPAGELKKTVPITPPEGQELGDWMEAHVTPDGKQLVTCMLYRPTQRFINPGWGSDPVFVERWDLATGKMLARERSGTASSPPILIPHTDGVLVVGTGPKIRDAVSGLSGITLTPTGSAVAEFHCVSTAALSPDGRVLALGAGRINNEVWLFEMRTGKQFRTLSPEGQMHHELRFLPDGRLVTASDTALVWAIGVQATTEGAEDLATLLAALAEPDPTKARPAMAELAGRGARATEFIRGRLQPVPKLKGDVARIVNALDATALKEREAASAELDRLGPAAVSAVKAQLRAGASDEVRTRAGRFLAKHDRALRPEELQTLRAIEVLEVIGGADARAVLDALAAGEPSAAVTRDAAGAVRRLGR